MASAHAKYAGRQRCQAVCWWSWLRVRNGRLALAGATVPPGTAGLPLRPRPPATQTRCKSIRAQPSCASQQKHPFCEAPVGQRTDLRDRQPARGTSAEPIRASARNRPPQKLPVPVGTVDAFWDAKPSQFRPREGNAAKPVPLRSHQSERRYPVAGGESSLQPLRLVERPPAEGFAGAQTDCCRHRYVYQAQRAAATASCAFTK